MHGLAGNGARLALAQLLSLSTLILLNWGQGSLAGPPGEAVGSGEQTSMRAARPIQSLSSSKVLISCRAGPGAHVTGADLWYTKDGGATWSKQSHAAPSDALVFDADAEGLYGFYIVLHNAAGASGPAPTAGTAPQRLVRIDRSAPIVKVLAANIDEHFEVNREIHLRWSARDEDLPDRPVKLHYRTEQTKTFRLIADCQAADSSYRWTVPEDVAGRIELEISAADRAGNTGHSIVDWLAIDPATKQAVKTTARPESGAGVGPPTSSGDATPRGNAKFEISGRPNAAAPHGTARGPEGSHAEPNAAAGPNAGSTPLGTDPPGVAPTIDSASAGRAQNLYDQATWHRLRGEYDLAAARLRETLELNPRLLSARNDLAGVLFLQGRHDEAEQEYRTVLAEDPRHAAALKGLALVQAARRNYQSSREALRKLVELAPDDAEAWLYLGDAELFTGDRPAARAAWTRASTRPGAEAEIKKRAQTRLGIYSETPSASRAQPTEREAHDGANR